MNKYGIKSTINHEVHEGHEENARSINALNLHALHVLHGYFFYIEYFDSLSGVGMYPAPAVRNTELVCLLYASYRKQQVVNYRLIA
ncbi:hypothetical protein [Methylobacter svalbardensis]|uniref:hypothetical protein n=1 Tax=Methylobacter svalbardensis TaxID=3080016 RepID=UPI0030EE6EDA